MATAYNLDTLIADLKKGSYTPKSEQEIQGIADRRYQSYYDQQRLGAQQAAETTGLALNRQMGEVIAAYGKQREQSAQQYKQASSDIGRALLSRGMQRSSYGVATLGDIAVAGNKAQQDIADTEQRAVGGIQDQQTLLARQLAAQIRQYSASQAADTLSYIDELESREYDRGTAADQYHNSLAAQIYQFAIQEKQQDQAAQQWTQQFAEGVRQYNQNYELDQQRMAEQTRQYDTSFAEQTRQYDTSFAEQMRQYDTSFAEQMRQYNQNYGLDQQRMAEQMRQYNQNYGLDQQRMAEQTRQYDTSFAEQQRQFDAGMQADQRKLAEQIRQYETSLTEQQRQFDTSTAEGQRQFDASLTMDQQKLAEQIRQFETSLTEQQRQYDTSFAEQQRQFDVAMQADQRKLDEQIRQFETSLTEQQRQFDTSTAEGRRQFDASLTLDQQKLAEQIRQFEAQMAENKRQFDEKNKPAATGGGAPPNPKDNPPAPPTDDGLMSELDKGFERKTNKNETYLDWSKRTQLLPNLANVGITPQNTPPSGLGLPKVPLTRDAMNYIGESRNVQKLKTGGR